jgi:hypothetical protein
MSGLIPLVSYELNKSYISKTLCENRAKPGKHCNGHCHLVKEIKKEQQRQKLPGGTVSEKQELLLFSDNSGLTIPLTASSILKHYGVYTSYNGCINSFSVFHPPRS